MPENKRPVAVSNLRMVSIGIVLMCSIVVIVITYFMYSFTASLLQKRLDERLIAIAGTASLMFDADEIKYLSSLDSEELVITQEYRDAVKTLHEIKEANPTVTFTYILGFTEDENLMTFIADADVVALKPELNFNEDELTDEGYPGSEYDVSGIEAIVNKRAFVSATVSPEIYEDYWGKLYSAYAPIRKDGEVIAILAIDTDISDYNAFVKATFLPFGIITVLLIWLLAIAIIFVLKMWNSRVELMRDLDRQKDELLSIVSHQLATPVSSIKWYLEMLEDGDLGEMNNDQKEHIKAMRGIGSNMSDLVSMILDVSRIQLGRMKIEKQDLDLNDFFHEIIATIDPKAAEKKVEFVKNIPEKLPIAKLDRRYTNMTIENLLSNAVKYTPTGGKVVCDVKVVNGNLNITVKDTGMGIPEAEKDKIFGRMYRASNARNAIDGNGFGLFVAKGAVEAQSGKIWFDSIEGKGTTFYVVLPLA